MVIGYRCGPGVEKIQSLLRTYATGINLHNNYTIILLIYYIACGIKTNYYGYLYKRFDDKLNVTKIREEIHLVFHTGQNTILEGCAISISNVQGVKMPPPPLTEETLFQYCLEPVVAYRLHITS